MSSPKDVHMPFPALIGRSKSRKEQAICHLSIKRKKKEKKKAFAVPEVVRVEQLKCLLPEVPCKDTQKKVFEIKTKTKHI